MSCLCSIFVMSPRQLISQCLSSSNMLSPPGDASRICRRACAWLGNARIMDAATFEASVSSRGIGKPLKALSLRKRRMDNLWIISYVSIL